MKFNPKQFRSDKSFIEFSIKLKKLFMKINFSLFIILVNIYNVCGADFCENNNLVPYTVDENPSANSKPINLFDKLEIQSRDTGGVLSQNYEPKDRTKDEAKNIQKKFNLISIILNFDEKNHDLKMKNIQKNLMWSVNVIA